MLLQLQLAIKWLFFFTLLAKKKQKKKCFSESYFEVDLVNKLQGVIDKQRGQIKKLDQSILDFKAENEEVNVTWIGSIHFRLLIWKQGKKLSWTNPFLANFKAEIEVFSNMYSTWFPLVKYLLIWLLNLITETIVAARRKRLTRMRH